MPTSTPSRPDADRRPRPIAEIARELGLGAEEWIPYGHDKAKVRVGALAARARPARRQAGGGLGDHARRRPARARRP